MSKQKKNIFLGLKFEWNLSVNIWGSGTDYCWLYCELQVNLFQKLATSAEHVVYQNCSECQNKNNNLCTQHVLQVFSLQFSWTMNNLLSYCWLVDAKIRASDKNLPVHFNTKQHVGMSCYERRVILQLVLPDWAYLVTIL